MSKYRRGRLSILFDQLKLSVKLAQEQDGCDGMEMVKQIIKERIALMESTNIKKVNKRFAQWKRLIQ